MPGERAPVRKNASTSSISHALAQQATVTARTASTINPRCLRTKFIITIPDPCDTNTPNLRNCGHGNVLRFVGQVVARNAVRRGFHLFGDGWMRGQSVALANAGYVLSSSSRDLASFRSAVSKPSVNQL